LAANVLGALAARRGDYPEAIRQASNSARAGEDYVRFNPADLNAWTYIDLGQSQLADYELEIGQVSQALAQMRATSALQEDPRSPAGMGWLLLQSRIALMRLESRTGQRAAAQQVLKQIASAVDERREQLKSDPERQALLVQGPALWRTLSDFALGDFEHAYGDAVDIDRRLAALQISPDNTSVNNTREFSRRGALRIATLSALATRRFAEAEALARLRMQLQPNPQDPSVDPKDEVARDHVMLAHSIATQGRLDEARSTLEPALTRFRSARSRGLTATMDYSYAMYVSALTQADDTAGRAKRLADLSEAESALSRLSEEARRLNDVRGLSTWIAQAR